MVEMPAGPFWRCCTFASGLGADEDRGGYGSDNIGPDWDQAARTIEASAGIAEPGQNFL